MRNMKNSSQSASSIYNYRRKLEKNRLQKQQSGFDNSAIKIDLKEKILKAIRASSNIVENKEKQRTNNSGGRYAIERVKKTSKSWAKPKTQANNYFLTTYQMQQPKLLFRSSINKNKLHSSQKTETNLEAINNFYQNQSIRYKNCGINPEYFSSCPPWKRKKQAEEISPWDDGF